MASIATIKLLCNEDSGVRICNQINSMMEEKKVDDYLLVDWIVDNIKGANSSIEQSLRNGTYKEGEFFGPWVIYSASEHAINNGKGFWSTVYGWTELQLATRYDGTDHPLPSSDNKDTGFMPIANFLKLP